MDNSQKGTLYGYLQKFEDKQFYISVQDSIAKEAYKDLRNIQ